MPDPLVITGTARSGTTLLSRMLSTHPDVMLAVDPYLPMFKSLRNSAVAQVRKRSSILSPAAPFLDYYFSETKLEMMDAVLAADLDLRLESGEVQRIREACRHRAALESPDLVTHLEQLRGRTYLDLFREGFRLIERVRDAGHRRWVGTKEVWILECLPALARTFDAARFIVIHRDPRSVLASMRRLAEKDPTQRGHSLSFLRHWRQHVALALHFASLPELRERLLVVRYEDLVCRPEATIMSICTFLGITYESKLAEAEEYPDHARKGSWRTNSAYGQTKGLSSKSVDRWRNELNSKATMLVEWTCGPEMALAGYASIEMLKKGDRQSDLLGYLLELDQEVVSWRSDFKDVQKDFGYELFRRTLVDLSHTLYVRDRDVRRSFLFQEVYDRIRATRQGV